MMVVVWMLFANVNAQIELDEINIPYGQELEQITENVPIRKNTEPIYINCLSEIELFELGIFSNIQCHNIQNHLKTFGPILHAQELIQCDISTSLLDSIFRQLDYRPTLKQQLLLFRPSKETMKIEFSGRLKPPSPSSQISTQFKNWGYESKLKIKLNPALHFGVSIDNDPGEKPIDFMSGYLHYKGTSLLKELILGNFIAQFNKGLTFGNTGQFGSPITLENYTYQPVGIKSYNSYNEDVGHFGTAVKLGLRQWEYYAGIGQKFIDCRLNEQKTAFTERSFGGFHQSDLQISRRHNNTEKMLFGGLQKSQKNMQINLLIAHYDYLMPREIMIHDDTQLIRSFNYFEGQITFGKILGGRWIANLGFDFATKTSASCLAGVYILNKNISWGCKLIRIEKNYTAPEMYQRLNQYRNSLGYESGFDIQLTRKIMFKMRVETTELLIPEYQNYPIENMQRQTLIMGFKQTRASEMLAQFRRETNFKSDLEVGKSFMYTAQFSQKIKIKERTHVQFGFTQKWNNQTINFNYVTFVNFQFQAAKNLGILIEQNWFNSLEGNLYQLDNSLPGSISYMAYNGTGELFNFVIKSKLWKHVGLNIKLQKMQKMNVKNTTEIDESNSYSRIFVQIKFQ